MATSKFSQTEVMFKDTRDTGGISVRGIELQADEKGCIQAPADLAKELEPHGFIPLDKWEREQGAKKQGTLGLKK